MRETGSQEKEMEKSVKHGWLFDVDGVLTHLEEKKNTEKNC